MAQAVFAPSPRAPGARARIGTGHTRSKPRVPPRATADGDGKRHPRTEVKFEREVPAGDERERDVCVTCGFVDYRNPKVVVGSVPVWVDPGSPEGSPPDERILLCRRGIEPRVGKWGFPQGFMELGETSREGAAREGLEESGATIVPGPLLSVYNLPGQVQLLYVSTVNGGTVDESDGVHHPPAVHTDGTESLEAGYFTYEEVCEKRAADELAFPTVWWAIDYWKANYSYETAGGTGSSRPVQPQQRTKRWPPVEGEPEFIEET